MTPTIISTMELHRPLAAQISPEWGRGYSEARHGQPEESKPSRDYQDGHKAGQKFNDKLAQAVSR